MCKRDSYSNVIEAAHALSGKNCGCDEFSLAVYPSSQPVFSDLVKKGAISDLMLSLIHICYMTWEPNKVLTSKWAVGEYTRGAVARIVDIDDLAKRPYTHGRLYTFVAGIMYRMSMITEKIQSIKRILPVMQ